MDMTYRAKGWLLAAAVSFAVWMLVAIASHEAIMLWDQPISELIEDHAA